MKKFNSSQTLGEIVTIFPNAADVFKQYKIDYCCGGNRPLIDAIKDQNLNESEIMDKINLLYEKFKNQPKDVDWTQAPLKDLVNHIINKHHAYLWAELPRISELTTLILRVHGNNHPELSKVHKLFHTIKMELESHLTKEETTQYPAIEKYVETGSLDDLQNAINIINDLENEHTGAGDILKELRIVTSDYEIPCDACGTYKKTYDKIQEMESDLFQHIHLENNILFPRLRNLNK